MYHNQIAKKQRLKENLKSRQSKKTHKVEQTFCLKQCKPAEDKSTQTTKMKCKEKEKKEQQQKRNREAKGTGTLWNGILYTKLES